MPKTLTVTFTDIPDMYSTELWKAANQASPIISHTGPVEEFKLSFSAMEKLTPRALIECLTHCVTMHVVHEHFKKTKGN